MNKILIFKLHKALINSKGLMKVKGLMKKEEKSKILKLGEMNKRNYGSISDFIIKENSF